MIAEDDPIQVVSALIELEALGRAGLIVSVVYGPSGSSGCLWSVDVLNRDGQAFDQPFAAESFRHAMSIAVKEVFDRGWLRPVSYPAIFR